MLATYSDGALRLYARQSYKELDSQPMVIEAWKNCGANWLVLRKDVWSDRPLSTSLNRLRESLGLPAEIGVEGHADVAHEEPPAIRDRDTPQFQFQ